MKFLNHRLAAAIFAASMVSVACAEPGQEGGDPMGGTAGQGEAAAPAFNDLDKDQDGYISAVEATGDSSLMDKWNSVDANADRKIDRSEFSKFEAKEAQPGAQVPATEGMNQGQGTEGAQEQEMPQEEGSQSQY